MEISSMWVNQINIPLNPSNNSPKGFAFVEFKSKNSALKTIKELNDKVVRGRKINAAIALDQRIYQNEQEQEKDNEEKKVDNIVEDITEAHADNKEEKIEDSPIIEEKTNENKNQQSKDNKDKGIVFVKNIDFDINADDFTEHFKAFDKITWAKVN